MNRLPLIAAGMILLVLLPACAGTSRQGPGPDQAADDEETERVDATPSAEGGQLPPAVARAVLGDHRDDWFEWVELPWDDPFLPRCDQLAGSEEPCERARTIAGSATAGQLVVLGPYELEEQSLELLVQGLSQLVVVLPDEDAAEQLATTVREVLRGWGADVQDLDVGDTAWAADHFDTAPGGFAEINPNLATRTVAVRRGRTLVVLSHADDPEDPRLETEPIATEIAGRLADAE